MKDLQDDCVKDDFDYRNAFEVANRDGINVIGNCNSNEFSVDDINFSIAWRDGENDSTSWLWLGRLKDGRYSFISAGCDYTGWG